MPCIRIAPPVKPELMPGEPANDGINTARLLDYLERLIPWAQLAWASCAPDGAK